MWGFWVGIAIVIGWRVSKAMRRGRCAPLTPKEKEARRKAAEKAYKAERKAEKTQEEIYIIREELERLRYQRELMGNYNDMVDPVHFDNLDATQLKQIIQNERSLAAMDKRIIQLEMKLKYME